MVLIQDSLSEAGIKGSLFSVESKGELKGRSKPWRSAKLDASDVLLIHHSHGNPALSDVLKSPCSKLLNYHNITPAQYFQHDRYLANLCHEGRTQLGEFKGQIEAGFTVSEYNQKELKRFHLPMKGLLPLLDLSTPPTQRSAQEERNSSENWLFVGKLTPHKNQACLLMTLFHFHQWAPETRLTLVGREDPFYGRYLRLLARRLGIENKVTFAGAVTESEKDRLYREADVFICLSLHEGFCVPIVEAMLAGVPIFSSAVTGLSETLGGAALEIDSDDPKEIAQIIHLATAQPDWKSQMKTGYPIRLEALRSTQNRARIAPMLKSYLKEAPNA